jgi:hypothetical protein
LRQRRQDLSHSGASRARGAGGLWAVDDGSRDHADTPRGSRRYPLARASWLGGKGGSVVPQQRRPDDDLPPEWFEPTDEELVEAEDQDGDDDYEWTSR